jgi:hypothetical protein
MSIDLLKTTPYVPRQGWLGDLFIKRTYRGVRDRQYPLLEYMRAEALHRTR